MHPHVKVAVLFAVISLAACMENPVDNQRRLIIAGSGPKSMQLSTEWAPLTLATADAYEPFQLTGTVDQNGYVSKDNPPASMGNDRRRHCRTIARMPCRLTAWPARRPLKTRALRTAAATKSRRLPAAARLY